MNRVLLAFLAGLIVMAGSGYWWLYGLPHRARPFPKGEVVDGIRELNRLVVFQAYITAITDAKECRFWGCPVEFAQTLISPAFVNYYVDLDNITGSSLELTGKELRVHLPPLMIERPNVDTVNVRIFNGGLWSEVSGANRRLEEQTRPMAVRQLRQRANMPFLVHAARKQALTVVMENVRGVLKATGHNDIAVTVRF